MLNSESQEHLGDGIAGYGALVEPVFDSFGVEDELLSGVFNQWVVVAELFEYLAVAWRSRIDSIYSEERPVPPSHPGHSDLNSHGFPFSNSVSSIPGACISVLRQVYYSAKRAQRFLHAPGISRLWT